MTAGGRVVKIQVPFPLPSFRLKAGLFPGLIISSELFITAKNCEEHSTREETQQQKLGSAGSRRFSEDSRQDPPSTLASSA